MDKKTQAKGFLLRIEPEMMEAVEKWAADEFRSVNGQLQWIIADALKRHSRKPSRRSGERREDGPIDG